MLRRRHLPRVVGWQCVHGLSNWIHFKAWRILLWSQLFHRKQEKKKERSRKNGKKKEEWQKDQKAKEQRTRSLSLTLSTWRRHMHLRWYPRQKILRNSVVRLFQSFYSYITVRKSHIQPYSLYVLTLTLVYNILIGIVGYFAQLHVCRRIGCTCSIRRAALQRTLNCTLLYVVSKLNTSTNCIEGFKVTLKLRA